MTERKFKECQFAIYTGESTNLNYGDYLTVGKYMGDNNYKVKRYLGNESYIISESYLIGFGKTDSEMIEELRDKVESLEESIEQLEKYINLI